MIIERKGNFSKKIYVDVKWCIEAEIFIKKTVKMLEYWSMWDTSEILNKIGFFDLIEHLYQEYITTDLNGQMVEHLYLIQLTRRILPYSEYKIVFNNHPSFEARWRDRLWYHMTHCSVFFVKTYKEILDAIKSIKDSNNRYFEIWNLMKWILKMLRIMGRFRRIFPFCEGCKFRREYKCKFWQEIYLEIRSFLCVIDEKARVTTIRTYFQKLKILCKWPQSIVGLKKL
ncbi:MAG: hypothetical protein ACFFD2_00625 [Promethearchaeota archaeon]